MSQKQQRVLVALLLVATTSAAIGANEKPPIIEKDNVPLQFHLFTPRDQKANTVHAGLLHADTYNWRVYPNVDQSFDGTQKTMTFVVDLIGPVQFTSAPLVIAIDGETFQIPEQVWTPYQAIFAQRRVAEMVSAGGLVRRISHATEVYVTILVDQQQFSVKLSEEQIGVFRLMLDKFMSLPGTER
jgi:hypothetical protein